MAAALLRSQADAMGLALTIRSGGVTAREGQPPLADATAVLRARWGIDIGLHRSHIADASEIEDADLVIGMEGWHGKAAAVLSEAAASRTFTLRGIVRLGADLHRAAHEPLRDWVLRLNEAEPVDTRLDVLEDAILDPAGQGAAAVFSTAVELDRCVHALLDAGLAPRPRRITGATLPAS